MALPNFKYESGLGHVAAYMASSKPYLSSSINVASGGNTVVTISFPNVSRFVTIKNMGPTSSVPAAMRFGFSANGVSASVNNNYFVLNNGESYTAEFRVTTLYLMTDGAAVTNNATASVAAGMTGIGVNDLANNWSGSSGVG
jgi:hypothetical protein